MSECKCKVGKLDSIMSAFSGAAFIITLPELIHYTIVASKRSSKHHKKFRLVLPKFITFRIYEAGISGGGWCSLTCWNYGISTLLISCRKGCDEIDGCHEYIEVKIAVPSTRIFEADMSMRQWINDSHQGIVIISDPIRKGNQLSSDYEKSPPRIPIGIPYSPISPVERFMIWMFDSQLKALPNSHRNRTKERKRHSTAKPNTVQSKPKRSSTSAKRSAKRSTSVQPKRKSNNAKLFD